MQGRALLLTGILLTGSPFISNGVTAHAQESTESVKPQDQKEETIVVAENENGTFIEQKGITDNNGNVMENSSLIYYKTDENNQKVEISKEEYDSLNLSQKDSTEGGGADETNDSVDNESANIQQSQAPSTISTPIEVEKPSITYSTHIQNIGWQEPVSNGKMAGTSGRGLQMEAIKISLDSKSLTGGISYKTHVQDIGWQNNVSNGALSGTVRENKQVEAIQISLTGEIANYYDVYYKVHVENYGWLDWAKNGQSAGSQGLAKQVEAIEIVLVEKGGQAPGLTNRPMVMEPSISYSTHVQDYGWLSPTSDGKVSGILGMGKKIESINIALKNKPYSGGITYKTHVQDYGWQDNVSNGANSGTTGKNKQVEAIQISLTGEMAEHYDVYYRVNTEKYGWLDWAKNGASAGTEGLAKRIEAIEILLVEKGEAAPGNVAKPFIVKPSVVYSSHVQDLGWLNNVTNGKSSGTVGQGKQMEAFKISLDGDSISGGLSYKAHVQDLGWLGGGSNGSIIGTIGEGKPIEAIQINLTGAAADQFDIYYRVHAEHYGWLGWAKNGASAGTEGLAKHLEAMEVVIVEKGKTAPGSTKTPFITGPSVVYSSHVQDLGWLNNVADGNASGTVGQGKRMEALKISLENAPYSGGITYKSHVQDLGWLGNVSNGAVTGTTGKGKRVEAIQINLTGEMALHYDVYYRVHAETYGWLDWAKNGELAGTASLAKRLESYQVVIVKKGEVAPGPVEKPFIQPGLVITNNYYNLSLNDALTMQMKVSPQTDKYSTQSAYVNSTLVNEFNGGSITGSSVNLRKSPSQSSDIYKSVGNGTLFKVINNNVTGDLVSGSTRWYQIEYEGQTLFVHSSLASANLRVGEVITEKLPIRSEQNDTSHIFATSPKGSLVVILEENNNGFHKIRIGNWRNATAQHTLEFLNPSNYISDEMQRLQFMDLTQPSGVSVETLNKYLVGKGILQGQGQAFIDAGLKYGVNEVYLMAHALLETGNGSSALANGIIYNGETVYNMYGIGALDQNPNFYGSKTAYEKGWTNVRTAIVEGAAFIANGYLDGNNGYEVVQNTLYEMRWNPKVMETKKLAGHQYATDIGWASKQVKVMYEVYKIQPYSIYLEIPIYK